MSDEREYNLDLSVGNRPAEEHPGGKRPFLSVQFACCGIYQRIYRAADGKSYQGRCPRCGKPVRFVVGPGGTDARSFIVH